MTWTFPASLASRAPMASATAPPTPVSISSNTSVGADPRSESTTLSANRKRDNSPPEATLISGPGRQPIDRRGIFARCGAKREQPFLDALQLCGVEVGRYQRGGEVLVGFLQRVDRGIDRPDRRLDQRRRIGRPPLQPPYGCR